VTLDLAAGFPSPAFFLETTWGYRRTAVLRTAIELDLFTALAEGPLEAATLATRCGAAARGMRILCDALVALGILWKERDRYALTPESAVFLNRTSLACMAEGLFFLSDPLIQAAFADLTAAVRQGGSTLKAAEVLAPDHPFWVNFARAMASMMAFPAEMIAQLLGAEGGEHWKVLDIAAGHGAFGIAVARHNPNAVITAVDWPGVLEIARQNAQTAGLGDRFRTMPGSAFDLELGTGYHLVLLMNFLHHFDPPACEGLLRRVHAALVPGGRAAALEFIPNEDRLAPELAVMFALNMLVHTPGGDAYTYAELERMFRNAGFDACEVHPLPPGPQSVVIARK